MLDFFHIPRSTVCDIQVFTTPVTTNNLQWSTWRKPRGISHILIFAVGGGGGGGGGFTRSAGAAGGGGGGGSASPQTTVRVPAMLLPDILYVQCGAGGVGVGSGGGTAANGIRSLVSIIPSSISNNIFVYANGGSGGVTGTGTANGAGGGTNAAAVITDMPLIGIGNWDAVQGQGGGAGGSQAGAVGTSITLPTNGPVVTGGAGGGGTTSADFAGGGFNATANAYFSEIRPIAPAAGSNDGSGGPQLWRPFFSFGGCGGSSSNTGVGGQGGNGARGAGGGGGGAGTTGGKGGDGGCGIMIIISW